MTPPSLSLIRTHEKSQAEEGTPHSGNHPEGDNQLNAKRTHVPREPPDVLWRPKTDFDDPENHFADWVEAHHAIHLSSEHRIITEQIGRWQARYPDHLAEQVAERVREVYRAAALSVFLATEALSIGKHDREQRFLQPDPMTLALMGYFREDEIIRQQLVVHFGKGRETGSATHSLPERRPPPRIPVARWQSLQSELDDDRADR